MSTSAPYTGDGVTTTFNVDFDFSDPATIHVTVDAVEQPFTWNTPSQVRLAAPPAPGASVLVYRETPVDEPVVVFADEQLLTAAALNEALEQVLFSQQEVREGFAQTKDAAVAEARTAAIEELAEAGVDEVGAHVLRPGMSGLIGNGTTDDRAAINAVLTLLGVGRPLVVGPGSYKVGDNLTINRPVVGGGGKFVIPNGVTLTVTGTISGPLSQLFELQGTGALVIDTATSTFGFPEWFYGTEWADAIETCFRLFPVTQLQRRDYTVGRKVKLNTPNRKLRGMGGIDYDGTRGTRIVLGSGSGDIMQLGPDANPGGDPGLTFLRGVHLSDFQLTRGAALVPVATAKDSPTGLSAQYVYDCHVDRVYSWENSIGFRYRGVVHSYFNRCKAHRAVPATTAVNDVAIGHYLDGEVAIGLAGGNASVYLTYCSASMQSASNAPLRIGLRGVGALADSFVDYFETVAGQKGIYLTGTGGGGAIGSNTDIRIRFPSLDQPSDKALEIESICPTGSVDIIDVYAGLPSGASRGIDLHDNGGSVTVNGGTLIGAAGGSTFGLRALNCTGLRVRGLAVSEFPNPVELDGVNNAQVDVSVNNQSVAATQAVSLTNGCQRVRVSPNVKGGASVFAAAAIMLYGDGNANVYVDATEVDPAACSGGRKLMVGATNVNITADGRVGGNGSRSASGTVVVDGVGTAAQAAIADDASGAANQAKVNAILAALRTYGIILT